MMSLRRILALILFVALMLFYKTAFYAQSYNDCRIITVQEYSLYVFCNGEYHLIKNEPLYGYGWLDSYRVFIASQEHGFAEASAILQIYDIRNGQLKTIGAPIGGVGDANFSVNEITGDIVFNDAVGIKLLRINLTDYSFKINLIKKGSYEGVLFWIDDSTISFLPKIGEKAGRIDINKSK